MVDQLRETSLLPTSLPLGSVMPRVAALGRSSVRFERHYTAGNDCSPARGVLVTGLYSHQTGCLITGKGLLSPGLPTWGTMLREVGYQTSWWGKWHLNPDPYASLDQYGFSGGTYPSPNGGPGQGTRKDPQIAHQFHEWFTNSAGDEPWCTTVSFVNPHDIAWWWRYTNEIPAEATPPTYVDAMPTNFETPEQLAAANKPQLQQALQATMARSFGDVPFDGPDAEPMWSGLMNTYLMLASYVDIEVGKVLDTLASRPKVAANTIVVFTADHGEYGGAHGMRGKGAAAYEEATRVPLYVHDPRGVATSAVQVPRTQLTSSADVSSMLLTLATGSRKWRREPGFSHLAARHDLAAICRDPGAPGRLYAIHATDEDVTEFVSDLTLANAPRHLIAVRTPYGKLATYSNWVPGTIEIDSIGEQRELYDYSTPAGQLELDNVEGASSLEEPLQGALNYAIRSELRAPLPTRLQAAQNAGIQNYLAGEVTEDAKVQADEQTGSGNPSAAVGAS
jgi:hypothetical protein